MAEQENYCRQTMNQISALINLMTVTNGQVGRLADTVGHYDAEFIKIGRNFHTLRQDMIGLRSDLDGLKIDVGDLRNELRHETGSLRSEMSGLKDEISSLRDEFASFKPSITERLDAIFLRLDEIENTGLRNEAALRNMASEMVLQHNAILNAIQDSHNNKLALEDFDRRLSDLEREVRQFRRN